MAWGLGMGSMGRPSACDYYRGHRLEAGDAMQQREGHDQEAEQCSRREKRRELHVGDLKWGPQRHRLFLVHMACISHTTMPHQGTRYTALRASGGSR